MVKKKVKKIDFKNIAVRATKTFIQGFLGAFMVFLNTNTTFDKNLLKSALIGALASGFSALMNYVLELLKKEG